VKKYAVDLDGVFFKFDERFAEWLNDKRGIKVDTSKLFTWEWYEAFPEVTQEIFQEEFQNFIMAGMFKTLDVVEGAVEGVKKLSSVGEVYIVTGRPFETLADTMTALTRHIPDNLIKGHYFVGDKSRVVNKLKLDVAIDDGPHIAKDIMTNTKARMYIMDRPYNKLVDYPAIRVKSWADIVDHEVP
jgi:5'(3')-deoxyribonucleotidase